VVKVAEIWADDVADPAALLVRSYLGKRAKVRARTPLGPGVTVVVGPGFEDLAAGLASVQAEQDATICSPPGSAA
jgi:hypothetical protein